MKTFMTAAAIVAVLTMPAFAEGDDASAKDGAGKGNVKATTAPGTPGAREGAGGAMGQGQAAPRAATTGAASEKKDPSKESAGSSTNVGEKTGVTSGGSK